MSNYKYSFFDNQLIGVDQLNEITSRLVSGGVSAVYSGVDFNVSDINDSNKAILTGGVVPESDSNLKVTALSNGYYLINPGLCFFNDGTTMEILSGGEPVSVLSGTMRYIYLVSDANLMQCYIEVLESPKTSGEFVLLAIVNADGTITDKRTYARGKVPGFYASNEGKEVNISETYSRGDITNGQTLEISVGNGDFRHLCVKVTGNCFFDSAGYNIDYGGLLYCDFKNGVAENIACCSKYFARNTIFQVDNNNGVCRIGTDIKLQNGKLLFPIAGFSLNTGYQVTFTYHLW